MSFLIPTAFFSNTRAFSRMVALELDISQVGESLRVFRIDGQLVVEFNRGVVVLA